MTVFAPSVARIARHLDLEITGEVGRGACSVVYRANRGSRHFALKVQAESDAEGTGVRLRKEACLLATLGADGTKVHEVGEIEGCSYLLRDFVDGRTLSSMLAEAALPESQVVRLAIDLTRALVRIHRRGLIHRDIKPSNVMVHQGTARLIDFGLATRIAAQNGSDVVGTLLYSAPEQTGMLKRAVDARGDLYSLGVVLYECLCGRPPFVSNDVGELVRMHASSAPPSFTALGCQVSAAMEAIISKALAKDPDDRYQSGEGLLADFLRLAEIEHEISDGKTIQLDSEVAVSSTEELPIVGRMSELTRLRQCWSLAHDGHGGAVLVQAGTGAGKSRLVLEVMAQARAVGALVLSAKSVHGNPAPFMALRTAIDEFLQQVESLPAEERTRCAAIMTDAAGESAHVLKRFLPGLDRLLAEEASSPADREEREDVFYAAVANFLVRWAAAYPSAFFFFDDIQWLDDATCQVLKRLGEQLVGSSILVVAAARSEAESRTEVAGVVEALGQAIKERISLRALGEQEIGQMVMADLGGAYQVDPTVIRMVATCAQGSPLAAREYVRSVLDAGLLRPSWGTWQIDAEKASKLHLPGDVTHLLMQRIAGLSDTSQKTLRTAAVFSGANFDRELLERVCASDDIDPAINEARSAHLLEGRTNGQYAFVHDQVREALLTSVAPLELKKIHQRWADVLASTEQIRARNVYALAHHAGHGDKEENWASLYQASLRAGREALAEFADVEALGFLNQAWEAALHLDEHCRRNLSEPLGDACARTGRMAAAIEHFEAALVGTPDGADRSRLRTKLGWVHLSHSDSRKAFAEIGQAFSEMGVRIPRAHPWDLVKSLVLWVSALLFGRMMATRDVAQREKCRRLARLYELAGVVAYFELRLLLFVQSTFRLLFVGFRIGASGELVEAMGCNGMLLCLLKFRRAGHRLFRGALSTSERTKDPIARARLEHYRALGTHFAGNYTSAQERSSNCLKEYGRWLPTADYLNVSADLASNLFMRGYARAALEITKQAASRLESSCRDVEAESLRHPWLYTYLIPINTVLGHAREAGGARKQAQAIAERLPGHRYVWALFFGQALQALVEGGELGVEAEQMVACFERLGFDPRTAPFHIRYVYLVQLNLRMEQCRTVSEERRPDAVTKLDGALRQLGVAANVPLLQCHWLLGRAMRHLLTRRHRLALKTLARAQEVAWEIDSPTALFEIARLRAEVLIAKGNVMGAANEVCVAQALAQTHQWQGRMRTLNRQFPGLASATSLGQPRSNSGSSDSPSVNYASVTLRRHRDALLQISRASASLLDPEKHARAALEELVKLFGAERAFLFLTLAGDGELRFVAGCDARGYVSTDLTGYSLTVVEQVRLTREPIVVAGTEEGVAIGSESIVTHDLRSIIAAPLVIGDRLLGVVYLDSRLAKGIFTHDDLDILLGIANHIAITQETARAAKMEIEVASEREQRRLAESLNALSRSLNSTLELDAVLDRLMEIVAEVVPYQWAAALMRVGEKFEIRKYRSPASQERTSANDPFDDSIAREVEVALKPVVASRAGRSDMGVPLIANGQVRGVLCMARNASEPFANREAEMAYAFCSQAIIAIENARLFGEVHRLAITDELTGVNNRRSLFELGERELKRARRYGIALSVIMLDVDHFKKVNDKHGHGAGDKVLCAVAERCRNAIRDVDVVGRYGGEEFAVILPDTDQERARSVAERLRQTIVATPVTCGADVLTVSASLGIAALENDGDLMALLGRADAALYRAKETGRNRVVAYGE